MFFSPNTKSITTEENHTVVELTNGSLFKLDPLANSIWHATTIFETVDDIVEQFLQIVPGSDNRVKDDVFSTVKYLKEVGIIVEYDKIDAVFYDVSMSGLGNRLRGLISCMAIGEIMKSPVILQWVPDKSCPSEFSSLFELPLGVQMFDDNTQLPDRTLRITDRTTPTKFYELYPFLHNRLTKKEFLTEYARQAKKMVPVEQIISRIEHNRSSLGLTNKSIGLHIRRTDHEKAADTPDEWFERIILSELESNPTNTILLCTDNPVTENKFLRHSIVRCYNKDWVNKPSTEITGNSRERFSSIEDAVVDLFLLSGCAAIYASESSFSRLAAVLGESKVINKRP